MNDEDHHKHRKYKLFCIFAIIIGILGWVLPEQENIAFEIVKNNTDLCDFNHTSLVCNGTRQNNVTYYTNNTPIVLYVFAHASAAGGVAGVFLYRDDILIEAQSGRPLATPEQTWRGITAIIPKNSSYRVNFTNFHHFEWYEDQILSGRNGTLSINQTVISGAGCTGNCSFNTILVNAIGKNLSVFPYFENIQLLAPLKSINGTSENQLDLGNASNTHFDLSSTDINFVASVSGNGTSGEVIISIDDAFKRSYNFNQSRLSLGGANLTDCANCGGSQNLSQVLNVGESANYQNITNLSSINNDVRFNDTNNTMQLNVPIEWINETGSDVSQAVNADNQLYTFLAVANHTTTNQGLISYMTINNNGWPYFLAKRARGNITNSTTANLQGILTDDYLLRFTAAGWYKNGTSFTGSKVAIDFRATNDWNKTSNPTYISISTTANGSTTLTERLRVWDNGSIQIISMASSTKTYLCQDHGFIVAGTPGC